jgi:hypothetical protein
MIRLMLSIIRYVFVGINVSNLSFQQTLGWDLLTDYELPRSYTVLVYARRKHSRKWSGGYCSSVLLIARFQDEFEI